MGLENTRTELDHYFRNHVAMVAIWLCRPDAALQGYNFKSHETCFVDGLRRTVTKALPEVGEVTYAALKDLASVAETLDWSTRTAIQELYRRYGELTGKRIDPFR